MLLRLTTLLLFATFIGCSSEIGEHFRDISDYDTVKSRLPKAGVQHFPNVAPPDSKMHGYFVPMQGGDGLQLLVGYEKPKFDALLSEMESKGHTFSVGVDLEDPETLLNGETSPQITVGIEPEIPNPNDRIFRIRTGPPIDCGMIFRTDKNAVVYWVYHDG